MRVWRNFAVLCSLLIGVPFAGASAQHKPSPKKEIEAKPEAHPEFLLVGWREKTTATARRLAHVRIGAERVRAFRRVPIDVIRVRDASRRDRIVAAYRARKDVRFIEPNYRLRIASVPNDPRFNELWGLLNTGQSGGTPGADINITNVWATLGTGSTNVIVAVIDTGIDHGHPDLSDNMWINPGEIAGNHVDDDGNGIVDDVYGARWTGGAGAPTSGNPMDGNGHGTHVAGTIGAIGNNGIGVAGVNWRVRLMALKFLDDDGFGWTADAIAAIEYAIDKGAHLSNNSWGGGGYSQALKDAIDAAGAAGQLFVAAAGNSNSDNDATPMYPASYDSPNVIAVAASDRNDNKASFSSFGRASVDISAPGVATLSTTPGGNYGTKQGTSMAAPHVSGAAALLKALFSSATADMIKAWLLDGARRLPSWETRVLSGGRLDVGESARIASLPAFAQPVSGFSASSANMASNVVLAWTNPASAEFSHVLIARGSNVYPSSWSGEVLVYSGALESAVDEPLPAGARLRYTIWAVYASGTNNYVSAPRYATARVGGEPDDYFTEWFSANDNDLAFKTLTLVPNASLNRYAAYTDPATDFPTHPAGGTLLTLGDDDFASVTVGTGKTVKLYGTAYSNLFVGSNGYITFGSGDTDFAETLADHFNRQRISMLFDDLNPASGGTVSWKQLSDRLAVTFQNVREYGASSENSFQVELFFDGIIRMTWLTLAVRDGLAGLSNGGGIPLNFVESDLSAYPPFDDLQIAPATGYNASGEEGGPFAPAYQVYVLTNIGTSPLSWSASTPSNWVSIAPSIGALLAGETISVTVSLSAAANALPYGLYAAHVTFSNSTSGIAQRRPISLAVARPGYTALFYADGFRGDNLILPALRRLGYQVVSASSWTHFEALLTGGTYTTAVAIAQISAPAAGYAAFSNHLAAGRRALLIDRSKNAAFGSLFGAIYVGPDNQTPVNIFEPDLAAGVTNPLPLSNPGYSRYAWGLAPSGSAESLAVFPAGQSAVVWGNNGRSALVGFAADALSGETGLKFFENLLRLVENGGNPLVVLPSAPWSAEGYELGPFAPSSRVFTLSNIGEMPLNWALSVPSNWVAFADTSGALAAGESVGVTGVIAAVANDLPPGTYAQTLIFSNATAGGAIKRRVALHIKPLPGVLALSDSISPTNDLYMPFGERIVGQTAVESITIRNIDPNYNLRVDSIVLLSAAISNFSTFAAAPANAATRPGDAAGAPYHPESLIVGFHSVTDLAARDDLHARVGATRVHRYRHIAADVVSVGKSSDLKAALATYRADPAVAYADLNYEVRAWVIPNDPRFGELWGLRNTGQTGGTPGADIRVVDAWPLATGDTNTIVAVLDTGIDYTHIDLLENLWINPGEMPGNGIDDDGNGIIDDVYGARWTGGFGAPTSGNPMDGNGHGTHVAGTIAARGNNGIGVVGVNWRARLMALKFLSDAGSGFIADAISALDYAIDQGARVSNNSWGGGGYSQALKDMIDAAGAAGHLFVAAAGNSATDNDLIPQYPASYNCPNIVAVASSDHNDARSSFSCFGRTTVHLAAPGSSILSTLPGSGYGTLSGTSMAAPHVAGAAALLWSLHPVASYELVKHALLAGVDILPEWTDLTVAGGRLNVFRSIQRVNPHFQIDGLPTLPEIVPPGSARTFTVVYRPIEAGVYTGRVRIVSNDASSPTTEVALAGSAVNDSLEIYPASGFLPEGPPGGPFVPDRMVYTLTNSGIAPLDWSASITSAWAVVTPPSGALAPGAMVSVTATLHEAAYDLPLGTYTAALRIANNTSGITNVRPIRLTIALPLCEAVDACDLPWTTGGDANWFSQTNVTSDGVDAAASGVIGDFAETWLQTVVEGPGALHFLWKVSSEANWDYLKFIVGATTRSEISGEVGWQLQQHEIPAGVHTLRWTYVKDSSLSEGVDRGWLDRVHYRRYLYAMADDHAGNYGPGSNFVHGANRGRGFEPWAIYLEGSSVADLFDSAPHAGNINSANNRAFRLYGGTGFSYVNAHRPFGSPLRSGDTFRAALAYNWNGGARGLSVLTFNNYELFNVNFGPGDVLSFKWGNAATTNLSTYWSPTTILRVAATQLASNRLRVTLHRSDGYTTNFTSSGLPAPAAQVKFYNGGHAGNDVRYALFVNHLSITRFNAHDMDGDGLPDWWESEYFGGPTNAHALALAAEGSYTIAEAWLADLNPLDPNARYPRAGIKHGPPHTIWIEIDPTSTARVYSIQYTTNLVNAPPTWVLQPPEMTGTGGAVYFHAPPVDPTRVYRTMIRTP